MKKQAKTEILSCRVTPEQREMIEERAFSSYRTPSMYLRDCALDKKIVVIYGVDELASELRKIGNNLNQLTRAVNSGYVYEIDLRETREEVARIWQSLNSLLQEVR
ncbi:MAG: MobC family plasmid mobilization relaxosome protein [Ruminococcus sp.]|nr:MobC family plasmid mobilization relaxosome protein [Ruminococcus sp.]